MSGYDFGQHMQEVAAKVLGEPNKHLSKASEKRYGSAGSLSVDLTKNTAYDHENMEGGGVLWLIQHQKLASSDGEAVQWLKEQGFPIPDSSGGGGAAAGSNKNAGPAKKEITATWDYTDLDGNLVFQVCRMQFKLPDGQWRLNRHGKVEKTFAQRRPFEEEKNVWITGLLDGEYMRKGPGQDWGRFDSERYEKWRMTERRYFAGLEHLPIYRLPEVVEAISMGQAIHLVEGEKKADALWAKGVPATCNAGGAKKWTPYHADLLRGAHIIQIPDNDQAGRAHMQVVGARMVGIAASVRMLDIRLFWPEAPEKGDIWDWVQLGNDAAELYDLVDRYAKPWEKEPPPSKYGAVPWDRLDDAGVEHEYLIDDILTRKELAILYGESKSGKSFQSIEMGCAVARGVEFYGRKVRKGGVIYQAGEGGIGVKKRLRAYRKIFMQPDEGKIPFVLLPARVDLFAREGDTEGLIAEIKAWAETFGGTKLELVVIDTLATATPGANENASTDMSTVLANCGRIQKECDCTVLIVHHKPKNGNAPRGHTSLFANIENAIEISVMERVDEEEREGGAPLLRQIRRATVVKNKDGEDGHGWDFVLKQVRLGERPDGKPITSCVCMSPGGTVSEARDDERLSDQQHMAFQALLNAVDKHGEDTPAMLSLPRSITTVVRYERWKEEYARLSMVDEEDEKKRAETIKKALQRAGQNFVRKKWVGRASPYVWVTGRFPPGFGADRKRRTRTESAPAQEINDGLRDVLEGGEGLW
jgi:hypothetical protein